MLRAVPAPSATFAGWKQGTNTVCRGRGYCFLSLNGDARVEARFQSNGPTRTARAFWNTRRLMWGADPRMLSMMPGPSYWHSPLQLWVTGDGSRARVIGRLFGELSLGQHKVKGKHWFAATIDTRSQVQSLTGFNQQGRVLAVSANADSTTIAAAFLTGPKIPNQWRLTQQNLGKSAPVTLPAPKNKTILGATFLGDALYLVAQQFGPTGPVYTLHRYSKGKQTWLHTLDDHIPGAIAATKDAFVLVSQRLTRTRAGFTGEALTVELRATSDRKLRWRQQYEVGDHGRALAAVAAPNGDAFVLAAPSTRVGLDRPVQTQLGASPRTLTLIKLSGNTGTIEWARPFYGNFATGTVTLARAPSGDLFVAGGVSGRFDLGGGATNLGITPGLFVAKYSPSGKHLWSDVYRVGRVIARPGLVTHQTSVQIIGSSVSSARGPMVRYSRIFSLGLVWGERQR